MLHLLCSAGDLRRRFSARVAIALHFHALAAACGLNAKAYRRIAQIAVYVSRTVTAPPHTVSAMSARCLTVYASSAAALYRIRTACCNMVALHTLHWHAAAQCSCESVSQTLDAASSTLSLPLSCADLPRFLSPQHLQYSVRAGRARTRRTAYGLAAYLTRPH